MEKTAKVFSITLNKCVPWIKHNCWHHSDRIKECVYKEDCDLLHPQRIKHSDVCILTGICTWKVVDGHIS